MDNLTYIHLHVNHKTVPNWENTLFVCDSIYGPCIFLQFVLICVGYVNSKEKTKYHKEKPIA
jgi:hypothetical protein